MKMNVLEMQKLFIAAQTLGANPALAAEIRAAISKAGESKASGEADKTLKASVYSAFRKVAIDAAAIGVKDSETVAAMIDYVVIGPDSPFTDKDATAKSIAVYKSTCAGLVPIFASGRLAELAEKAGIERAEPLTPENVSRNEATKLIRAARMESSVTAVDRAKACIAAITEALKDVIKVDTKGLEREEARKLKAKAAESSLGLLEGMLSDLCGEAALADLPKVTANGKEARVEDAEPAAEAA